MSELIKTAASILFFYFLHFRFLYILSLSKATSAILALFQLVLAIQVISSWLSSRRLNFICLIQKIIFKTGTDVLLLNLQSNAFFIFSLIFHKVFCPTPNPFKLILTQEKIYQAWHLVAERSFQPLEFQSQMDALEPDFKTWILSKHCSLG